MISFRRLTWLFAFSVATTGSMRTNTPPPAAPNEIVYRPTGTEYSRTPQIIQGKRAAPEYDHVHLKLETLADIAQVYADFSKKEVRVPRSLLDRKLAASRGGPAIAFGYVIYMLESNLAHDGINIESLGANIVAFRPGKNFQEQMQDMQSGTASSEQIASAKARLNEERFWQLIEAASRGGRTEPQRMGIVLQAALSRLSAEEIFGFQLRLHDCLSASYRWDLWAVAYIVNGGASDDAFEYFRAWLISQGREYFQAALRNPLRAADRARKGQQHECESLVYSALQAYQAKTNKLPPNPPVSAVRTEPDGMPWQEQDLPRLYPELVKKFR